MGVLCVKKMRPRNFSKVNHVWSVVYLKRDAKHISPVFVGIMKADLNIKEVRETAKTVRKIISEDLERKLSQYFFFLSYTIL